MKWGIYARNTHSDFPEELFMLAAWHRMLDAQATLNRIISPLAIRPLEELGVVLRVLPLSEKDEQKLRVAGLLDE